MRWSTVNRVTDAFDETSDIERAVSLGVDTVTVSSDSLTAVEGVVAAPADQDIPLVSCPPTRCATGRDKWTP